MSLAWRWLLIAAALAAVTALPVPDEIVDTATKLLGSSVVTSVSVVMGQEDGNNSKDKEAEKSDTRKVTDDLPASPVDMLKPDGFQFYTVDDKGQLITRQMTDAEIQSIIAAGGGPFPIETQDSEKNGENLTGDMKVADVVQSVQNVLQGELNKPAVAMGTVPTIPGHANAEWSSILPAILGGETESAPVTLPVTDAPLQETKQNVSAESPAAVESSPEKLAAPEKPEIAISEAKPQDIESTVKPAGEQFASDEPPKPDKSQTVKDTEEPLKTDSVPSKKPEAASERPMIQVPVITTDTAQSVTKDPSPSEEKPVYQILNTISADEVKDKDKVAETLEETKTALQEEEKPSPVVAVPSKEPSDSSAGIHSTTEKVESESKEPEVVAVPETEPSDSSTGIVPGTEKTENEAQPTAATFETVVDVDVSSSSVPEAQGEPDKLSSSSGLKETEEAKPDLEATSGASKVQTPSIILEAPVEEEKPVQSLKPEENMAQIIPELKPAAEDDNSDKNSASADQTTALPSLEAETTTSAATIEEEVSEIVNLLPQSISSIVDELTSEITAEVEAEVKPEDPKVSADALPEEKKPETAAVPVAEESTKTEEVGTKVGDSDDKAGNSEASVSMDSEISDVKKTPEVIPTSKEPEIEVQPVFQMLPEINPESTDTKIAAEATPAPSENVEDKPEPTEAVVEPTKIVPEETTVVEKIEKPSEAVNEKEATQNLVPVIEVAAPVTAKPDSVSDKNGDSVAQTPQAAAEKKPETLLTELADSVSSMISQVSETVPSMVPIPQKPESSEQPLKRVEDGVKAAEAGTVKTEVPVTAATMAAEEPDVESPPKAVATQESNGATTKPENNDSEVTMVEIKTSEPTTSSPNLVASGSTVISLSVSADLPESSSTPTVEKPDSQKVETPSKSDSDIVKVESPGSEEQKTQQVEAAPGDSEPTKIPESSSDEKPVKSEEAVPAKPEEAKPDVDADKIKNAAKDEVKTETTDVEAEAPIVRIDITEAKPTDSDVKNHSTTESSVVRIQLTDPVSTINQMIDSAPVRESLVKVEDISFPEKNVLQGSMAQNAASDLIAGAQPTDTTETKTEDLPGQKTSVPAGDKIVENAGAVETVNTDADVKPTSSTDLKSDAETLSDEKSRPETENAKIPEAQETEAKAEAKPEVTTELNEKLEKLPTPQTEISTASESSDAKKPEESVESQAPKDTAASVQASAKPVVKIDQPVPVVEEIESPMKNEEEMKTRPTTETIIEPVTMVVSEDKAEESSTDKPAKKPADVPKVEETLPAVPPEIVVSKIVEVQPTQASINPEPKPEMIKEDTAKPLSSEEKKPEETVSTTKTVSVESALPEKIETKPEADKTATKVTETPIETTVNFFPVELATPAPPLSDSQSSDHKPEVSTSVSKEEDKVPEKIEAQEKIQAPVTEATTQDTEPKKEQNDLPDVKPESPAATESSDATQSVKESSVSVAEPEATKTEEVKSQPSGDKPEKETPSATKPAVPDAAVKDQASVPLVRIDISPEKNQLEITTEAEKIEKKPAAADADDKKAEKPETPAVTEIKLPEEDESAKKGEKPKDDSMSQTSSVKSEEKETTGNSESASKAPVEAGAIPEKDNAQVHPVTEAVVVVKTTEASVKETVNTVDSKLPEAMVQIETTGPTATKVESGEETGKPVVRIDTTENTAPTNGPVKTQEIRIQVNDTAVLVTKQQIPQDTVSNDNKVEPAEVPSKMEASSKLPEPTKAPAVQKPAESVTDSQKTTEKTTADNLDKVKTESTTAQKKPAADPYVKLGEKKQEKKPVNADPPKTPSLGEKKTENTEDNKDADAEDKWTLIPHKEPYPILKQDAIPEPATEPALINKNEAESGEVSVPLEAHQSAVNLEESTRDLDKDIGLFAKLCNELAFSFWMAANKGLSTARSLALSPFGMTSMLAMVFLGARGPTSGQMNDILKLDDVVTFNPHLVFQNVTDSVNLARGQGIANAAFVRELFSDRLKAGRLLPFYKERAQQFYDGHVEEVNFATISDLVRRRTNLLIRRQTGGRIRDFVKGNVMPLRSPLAALSANVFQTDCTGASTEGRDGEMYFAVLPAVRQRKLVPVPATVWRSGVLAGYEPGLDATVVSLGGVGNLVSTIFVLPGQQGLAAPGDSLDHLERRLLEGAFAQGAWDRLLRVLIPRMGLEVQVPKFSHRSVVNATAALKRMGLDDLFSKHADLKGINGVGNDLHLSDMLQINLFSTCGDEVITGGRHHVEIYPASPLRGARGDKKSIETEGTTEDQEDAEVRENEDNSRSRRSLKVVEYVQGAHQVDRRSSSLPAEEQLITEDDQDEERSQRSSMSMKIQSMQGSKGKQSERPLLKLDRPFLYFVRHNPTGMVLHMGRFNPRLMP